MTALVTFIPHLEGRLGVDLRLQAPRSAVSRGASMVRGSFLARPPTRSAGLRADACGHDPSRDHSAIRYLSRSSTSSNRRNRSAESSDPLKHWLPWWAGGYSESPRQAASSLSGSLGEAKCQRVVNRRESCGSRKEGQEQLVEPAVLHARQVFGQKKDRRRAPVVHGRGAGGRPTCGAAWVMPLPGGIVAMIAAPDGQVGEESAGCTEGLVGGQSPLSEGQGPLRVVHDRWGGGSGGRLRV